MAKPFDIILVWKYSRFARNREDSIIFKTMLRKAGVQVRSLSVSRLSVTSVELESVNHRLERLYDALETGSLKLADLATPDTALKATPRTIKCCTLRIGKPAF